MIDIQDEIAARLKQDAPSGLTNLQIRIISGVLMAAVALALTWVGGMPFRILAAVIAAGILWEWTAMPTKEHTTGHDVVCALLLAVVLVFLIADVSAQSVFALLAGAFVIAAGVGLAFAQGTWGAWGVLYAGLAAASLSYLRRDNGDGLAAILFLFAVVWGTDIFAYFCGRALGGAKLAPHISPNKTWSGALGGAAGGVGAGIGVALAVGIRDGLTIPLVALFLSVASQAGDLFESAIKRRYRRKDSSHLIPGHGGVMDRVDGLVAAAIALYLVGWLFADAQSPARGLFAG